jgi:hypothetical protein
VPVDGEITFKHLAEILGVNEGAAARILRLGNALRVFREPRPGVIAHSAAFRQIADDERVASWVGANVDEMWSAAEKLWRRYRSGLGLRSPTKLDFRWPTRPTWTSTPSCRRSRNEHADLEVR